MDGTGPPWWPDGSSVERTTASAAARSRSRGAVPASRRRAVSAMIADGGVSSTKRDLGLDLRGETQRLEHGGLLESTYRWDFRTGHNGAKTKNSVGQVKGIAKSRGLPGQADCQFKRM